MDDLTAFLTARLDEDEATAKRAAYSGAVWAQVDPVRYPGHIDAEHGIVVYDEGSPDENQAPHIARHDPARVLREVEAKRAILGWHHPEWGDYVDGDGIERATHECAECEPPGTPDNWPCRTVRALAAIWRGHPDFRPEWKP